MRSARVYCWEAFDGSDPLVRAAERLYDRTQHPDERIPWGWIARSIKGRTQWRPGSPGRHLLLATSELRVESSELKVEDREPIRSELSTLNSQLSTLVGFAYSSHLPGYGGYVSYLGVDEAHRGRGVGTRLFDQTYKVLAADAGAGDEPLPFVVWESHKPTEDAPDADWKLWEARVKLFDKAGGLWVDGVELQTPNYAGEEGPPVPLQLFVRPIDKPAGSFTPADVTAVAAGLLERIYRTKPGDRLYDATLSGARRPRLRPAREAGRRRALAGV